MDQLRYLPCLLKVNETVSVFADMLVDMVDTAGMVRMVDTAVIADMAGTVDMDTETLAMADTDTTDSKEVGSRLHIFLICGPLEVTHSQELGADLSTSRGALEPFALWTS